MGSAAKGESAVDRYAETFDRGASLEELGFSGVRFWELDAAEGCMRFSAHGGKRNYAAAESPRFDASPGDQGVEAEWKVRFDRGDHQGRGGRAALWVSLRDGVGEGGYTLLATPRHGHGHRAGLELDLAEKRGGKNRHLGHYRLNGAQESRWLSFALVVSPPPAGQREGRLRLLLNGEAVISARSAVPERFSHLTFRGRLDAAERMNGRVGFAGERAIRIDDLLVRGANGSASAPTVVMRVEPERIRLGDSATLVWQSERAEACSISPDAGSVALSGSLSVRPERTTVYRIVASGSGGSAEAEATLIVEEGIRLRIDTPLQGALIAERSVRVEGIVESGGREVGVTVNGLPALQDAERFVVNAVPLAPGANTLQAVATDGETGLQVAAEVNLHCEPGAGFFRLTAQRQSGLAPFETPVTIEASFAPILPEFEVEDPGGAEIIEGDDALQRRVRLENPGLVTLTAVGRDEAGVYREARITLQALDRAELDGILQNKFERMKAALGAGEFEDALAEFTSPVREKYRTLFQGLQERMPAIAARMRPIEMIVAGEDRARYRIRQPVTINGQQNEIATYIHFTREDGLWRIESF